MKQLQNEGDGGMEGMSMVSRKIINEKHGIDTNKLFLISDKIKILQ